MGRVYWSILERFQSEQSERFSTAVICKVSYGFILYLQLNKRCRLKGIRERKFATVDGKYTTLNAVFAWFVRGIYSSVS